jgi:hypothetical protein
MSCKKCELENHSAVSVRPHQIFRNANRCGFSGLAGFNYIFSLCVRIKLSVGSYMLVNATSEALQAKDNALALAATSVDNLKTAIAAMRSDVSYQRMFNAAEQRCELLNIGVFGEDPIDQSSKNVRRRAACKRKVPASLQGCALDLFLMKSSDSLPYKSAEEQLSNEMKLDFFASDRHLAQFTLDTL